jgi:hypothetical protein
MTKKKFAELELSLLHLQQNVEIPETHLIIHPVIQRTVEQVIHRFPLLRLLFLIQLWVFPRHKQLGHDRTSHKFLPNSLTTAPFLIPFMAMSMRGSSLFNPSPS